MSDSTIPYAKDILNHWLLNLAVDFPVPFWTIFPDLVGALNVVPFPGGTGTLYRDGMLALVERGMLQFSVNLPGEEVEGPEDRRPIESVAEIREAIDAALAGPLYVRDRRFQERQEDIRTGRRRPQYRFQLTPAGGAEWERLSKPDWSRFYYGESDGEECAAVSPDLGAIVARLGWARQTAAVLIRESVSVRRMDDYPVLYWKRLPRVYRADFAETRLPESEGVPEVPRWLEQWFSSLDGWYTAPWSSPDWPGPPRVLRDWWVDDPVRVPQRLTRWQDRPAPQPAVPHDRAAAETAVPPQSKDQSQP